MYFNEVTGSKALTYPELLSKARHAVGVVGIRSGLIDFLKCAGVPMFVCYRSFPDRGFNTPACDANSVIKMFSLRRAESESRVMEVLAEPLVDLLNFELWLNSLRTGK